MAINFTLSSTCLLLMFLQNKCAFLLASGRAKEGPSLWVPGYHRDNGAARGFMDPQNPPLNPQNM